MSSELTRSIDGLYDRRVWPWITFMFADKDDMMTIEILDQRRLHLDRSCVHSVLRSLGTLTHRLDVPGTILYTQITVRVTSPNHLLYPTRVALQLRGNLFPNRIDDFGNDRINGPGSGIVVMRKLLVDSASHRLDGFTHVFGSVVLEQLFESRLGAGGVEGDLGWRRIGQHTFDIVEKVL